MFSARDLERKCKVELIFNQFYDLNNPQILCPKWLQDADLKGHYHLKYISFEIVLQFRRHRKEDFLSVWHLFVSQFLIQSHVYGNENLQCKGSDACIVHVFFKVHENYDPF